MLQLFREYIGVLLAVLLAVYLGYQFLFAAKCAVEIYKVDATGEMIYCQTGDLSNSADHTYMGSGTIDCDKADHCG